MIREIEKKETKKQEKVETPPNELENQNEDPMVDSLNILNQEPVKEVKEQKD